MGRAERKRERRWRRAESASQKLRGSVQPNANLRPVAQSRTLPALPPAPSASNPDVLRRMRLQRRHRTSCELAIRSALHRLGWRFRTNSRPIKAYRRRADVVFSSLRVAVFVDGCFWHGCPKHGSRPVSNREWWALKIRRNRLRDLQTTRYLRRRGWSAIRVWEHEPVDQAVKKIAAVLNRVRT